VLLESVTIEYILRLASVEQPLRYARSAFGLIDLLAILPSYVSVLLPGAQSLLVIRLLRLLRVFRVLKLAEYLRESRTLVQALRASWRKIAVFLLAVTTIVVVVGTLMYVIEGERHGFTSIPISLYWAVVTLTTVGYGDLAPVTTAGRVLAVVLMLTGYGIIAVPTGIVTAELARASTARHRPRRVPPAGLRRMSPMPSTAAGADPGCDVRGRSAGRRRYSSVRHHHAQYHDWSQHLRPRLNPTRPKKSTKKTKSRRPDLAAKRFRSQAAWEIWLKTHHQSSPGVWLEFAKKGSGLITVSYREALEVALCYGWIDGLVAPVDAKVYRQRFTPRRPRSKWSQINVASVERLHAEGRLAPAALREMEAAQRDGRWAAAYPPPSKMRPPEDLEAALEQYPEARRFFEGLNSQNRYAILYRLHDAKRPETRARRLEEFVRMLRDGKTLH
jgi:uncharacterized protein YdeI (YjbR/CyaY-like superfamily)/voltage-gated potassium channel Kch